jgi:hypothetical protein
MEITSGANFIAATSIIFPVKNFLILGFTVFGGFSIMFQSFAQLPETFLKRNYAFGKIEQFVIFCILYGFFLYI